MSLPYRFAWLGLLALFLTVVISAHAAANTVPRTAVDQATFTITANNLKPADCDLINLTRVVVGNTGTNSSELILGGSGNNTMNGGGGADCILGGGGADIINGGSGTDILLGGDGNDRLSGDGDTDACVGGAGTDTFTNSCEYTFD